nr:uncharacterized mitochondrial protein AtMg00810-like [Tanacetum cinerariifolium]
MNQVLNENERLLKQVINKDIVNIVVNSSVDNDSVNMHECKKCLKLETELLNQKNFIEKETWYKLFRSYTTLEKHCISLEVDTQLNQENFQMDNYVSNQSALNFNQYFKLKELKAQSQDKDMVISKLKERIKSLSGNVNKDKVVQIVLGYLDSGSSKHMIGDRSQLTNFVNKFLGTIKFGNDHVEKIMGYRDYQIGNVTILKKQWLPHVTPKTVPDLSFLHVFGALFYPTNDSVNLGKLRPKADIGIFIEYAPTKKAFRIYNRRTRRIIETIHVDFDELTAMASEHSNNSDNNPVFILKATPKVIALIAEVLAPEPVASTSSPSSTTVDQFAPSPSNCQTSPETQSLVISNDVEEENHDLELVLLVYFNDVNTALIEQNDTAVEETKGITLNYPIWQVIQNGNGPVSVTTDTNGMIKVLPSKTAEEVVARKRERKARTTLLTVLPGDHLAKFHKMADAKEINTNDVSTAYSVSSHSVLKSQKEGSASYTNEINDDYMEEMDLKWQVAMLSMRIKKFHKRTCKKVKGNQDSRRRDGGYNGNKARDNGRRPAYQDNSKALVTINGEDIEWSRHVEEDTQNYAMMAYSSSNSGSDNEVKSCSKTCEESYARLKKLYDEQIDKLSDASVEITAYTLALKRLLNTQMSAIDKFRLGYGDYRYGSILSYENEVLQRNYMPSRPDVEIDYSKFTYGPKQTSADESDSKPIEYASSDSDSSIETTTSMHAPVDHAPKIICEPKVWTHAPIIEEYELDSDDDSVSNVQEHKEKPSFAFTDYVKHVKSLRENIKETFTANQIPKIEKQDKHGHTKKGLGYSRKACFVCGNKAHLADYQEFKGGSVAFGGSNGRITGKGKLKAGKLDFKDVHYVKELKHYYLFSVYFVEILKKFDFLSVKTASTPIETQKPLVKDEEAADVDVTPKTSHLQAVKRIFRYLKGKPKLGLWYSKVSLFDLEAYSDSDYAGANLDRKSTTGATLVTGRLLEVTTAKQRRKLQEVKLDLKSSCWDRGSFYVGFHTIPQMVINSPCLTHIKNWLVQEQTALDLITNQVDDLSSHTTKYTSSPITQKAAIKEEDEEDETCTTLSHKLAALEQDKVAQAWEILKLKRRVKKLEKQRRSKSSGLKRLRKVEIDADEEITLVDMEIQDDLGGWLEEKDEVNVAAKQVNVVEPTVFDDEEMAKRLHNEEVEQAVAREKKEQDDFKRAQELQQQYDQKQENTDWNIIAE